MRAKFQFHTLVKNHSLKSWKAINNKIFEKWNVDKSNGNKERLEVLGLTKLKKRRKRRDLTQIFKQ